MVKRDMFYFADIDEKFIDSIYELLGEIKKIRVEIE